MLQYKYLLSKYSQLDTNNILNITLQEIYKKGIEIWWRNGFKKYRYPIFAGLIRDDKKQVFITEIKANMQFPICYFLLKKRKIAIKL